MRAQKILGKKFVRGKPYYKIKWIGSGKDQATWETPPALEKYKPMINNYEIRNWGVPLDEKFFDQAIYVNKGFAHRSKYLSDKKGMKQAKVKEKKKIEEHSQFSEESQQESQSSEEQAKPRKATKQPPKKQKSTSTKKISEERGKSQVGREPQQVMIIDSDSDDADKDKNSHQIPTKSPKQKDQQKSQGLPDNNGGIRNCSPTSESESPSSSSISATQKDLGLILEPELLQQQNTAQAHKKQLKISNMIGIQVPATQIQSKVIQIYHLERLSKGNHLYLVEYEDKRMVKLTTSQLMAWHADELVFFLQRKLRLKAKQ